MTRLLPGIALLLTALFSLMMIVITAQPYSDALDRQFSGCGAPCWQGIQPGTSSREEVLAQLGGDPLSPLCFSRTSVPCEMFQWSQPDTPPRTTGIQIQSGKVYSVTLKSPGFTFASVLLTLRRLNHPLYGVEVGYNLDWMYLWLTFSDASIGVSTRSNCPTTYDTLLGAPVDMIVIQALDDRTPHEPTRLGLLRETVYHLCER